MDKTKKNGFLRKYSLVVKNVFMTATYCHMVLGFPAPPFKKKDQEKIFVVI